MKKLFILVAAVLFVLAYTLPVMAAAQWNFYGNARMSTFYDMDSGDVSATAFDDDDLTWGLQGNSRIGASVKAGDIGGGFEYGTGVNVRKLYGTWDFGGGQLLVGQTYTPVNVFPSNQVYGGDTDLLPYGGIYNGRRPMIQLKFGGLKLAFVEPHTGNVSGAADTDTSIPKVEASYLFKTGGFAIKPMAGYNVYEEVDALDNGTSVSSYFAGLYLKYAAGPFYVAGDVYMGQNLGQYGLWQQGADDAGWSGTDVVDNDTFGFLGVVGFKVNDMLTFEAGYGQNSHELDGASDSDDTASYYANATINLAKGCFIVPEIGVVDYKDSAAGVDQGDTSYFGAKWQINF
ncbi:MAG TPA: hypothetical protein DDW42_10420 [Desulfobacteraceae bacterium]|nr:hypothetical protein [Desulfobacteraceae bacterium]